MHSLIFFGVDQYSAIVLQRIIDDQNIAILAVVTDRGKPKGREQKREPNPVEKLAITQNIKVLYYPEKSEEMSNFIDMLKSYHYEYGLVASFGHILPSPLIKTFLKSILNIHPSLLPQYRGVAPVPYALALGDTTTGVSIFTIDEGVDTGKVVAQEKIPTPPGIEAPDLLSELFARGAGLVADYISGKPVPNVQSQHQEKEDLVYAKRFTRDSGYVEWPVVQKLLANQPIAPDETTNLLLKLRLAKIKTQHLKIENWSLEIARLCRALTPWPGVWTICPTKKGNLRLTLVLTRSHTRYATPEILIAGKPKPILWSEFTKYYL